MKILVLTLADSNFSDVADISMPNKIMYSSIHRYHFIQEFELLDKTRSASWNKILFLQEHLPNYDWIWWTDADSLVMNMEIRLENIIDEDDDDICAPDMIITEDYNGLNAGQFLIRNCDWSIEFLKRVYNEDQFINHHWWEQAAIQTVLSNDSYANLHLEVTHQSVMNSIVHSNPELTSYEPGDFIAHFAGLGREKHNLIGLMRKYAYGEPFQCYW